MFSLRTLFVAMAIAAICIAGLVQRTPLWANIVVTLTLCLLGYGLIAIYLSPSKRPFFVPAVIAGCLYGAAAYWQPPSLVTDGLLFSWWYSDNSVSVDKLFRKVSEMPWNMAVMSAVLSDKPERIAPYLNSFGVLDLLPIQASLRSHRQIGHSTIAIVLAVCAGLVGSYVARQRDVNARASHVQS